VNKIVPAFLLGVLVAGGSAYLLTRPKVTQPEAVVVAESKPIPAADPIPAVESPTPAPVPVIPPKASEKTKKIARRAELPVVDKPVATEPPAPQPTPVPAAPGEPTVTPTPKPEPTPVNPPSGTKDEPKESRSARTVTIPEGTVIAVSLAERISSDTHESGATFTATLAQPLTVDGLVLAERNARAHGRIVESVKAGRVRGLAKLELELTGLTMSDGQKIEFRTAAFAKEAEAGTKKDAAKVGVGAAIGAAIGAIAGGGRGAAIGAAAGGGAGAGTVIATRGDAVELPVETRLSFRVAAPVSVTEKIK